MHAHTHTRACTHTGLTFLKRYQIWKGVAQKFVGSLDEEREQGVLLPEMLPAGLLSEEEGSGRRWV